MDPNGLSNLQLLQLILFAAGYEDLPPSDPLEDELLPFRVQL